MKRYIPLTVGVIIFLYVLNWVDASNVVKILRNISIPYFIGAVALMGVSYSIKLFRWVILVISRHKTLSISHLLTIFTVSYGLSVSLPSKSGDVAGLEVSRRYAGISYGDGFGFIAFYRLSDIGITLLMATFASLSISDRIKLEWLRPVLILSSIILLILFMLFLFPPTSEKIVKFLLRIVTRDIGERATSFRKMIQNSLEDYLATIRMSNHKKWILFAISGLTIIRWILELKAFQFLLSSVEVEIGLTLTMLIFSSRIIIAVIAFIPFGFGTTILPTLAIFTIFSVPMAAAVAVDVLSNFIGPIVIAILGLLFTGYLREHKPTSEKEPV